MEADNYEMTQAEIAAALNEWMRRYIADPDAFEHELNTVREFEAEEGDDGPSYGTKNAAYLLSIHRDLQKEFA